MKKKKFIAWLLAAAMTMGSVTPVAAADLEMFGDGGTGTPQVTQQPVPAEQQETEEQLEMEPVQQEALPTSALEQEAEEIEEFSSPENVIAQPEEVEESTLFSDGSEENGSVQMFSDGIDDGNSLADAVEIQLGQDVILTKNSDDGVARWYINVAEAGTYQITETLEEPYVHAVKLSEGIHSFAIDLPESYDTITVSVKKVKSITGIQVDLSEDVPVVGYMELGGQDIHHVLSEYYTPRITVFFEDRSSVSCNFGDYLEGYGSFIPVIENLQADSGNLSIGEYQFHIYNTSTFDVSTQSYTYSLKSIEDIDIPVISQSSTESIEKNYDFCYIYKVSASKDRLTTFLITHQEETANIIYNTNGEFQFGLTASTFEVNAQAGESYYVVARSDTDANTLTVGTKVYEDVWNNQTITAPGEYTFILSDGCDVFYDFIPRESGYYYVSIDDEEQQSHNVYTEEESYSGTPMVFWGEAGQTYSMDTFVFLEEEEKLFSVNIKKIEQYSVLGTNTSVTVTPNENGEAIFLFKPTEDGVYSFDLSEESFNYDVEGWNMTELSICHGKGTYYYGFAWAENGISFEKDKEYWIKVNDFNEEAGPFEISAIKKQKITSVEISDGLEQLQTEWVYGFVNFGFGMDALSFKVTFDDGEILENVQINERFTHNNSEYYIDTTLEERPPIINDNEEEVSPGDYRIGFSVIGMGDEQPESMPEPLSMTVKRTNEFSENDFPVLELGKNYSLGDFERNYRNGQDYVFQFKPSLTGSYDINEFVSNAWSNSYWVDIITESGQMEGFNANNVEMNGGETYFITLSEGEGNFDFQIKKASLVSLLTLDTEEMKLAPGQTGTLLALVEPTTATEELEWSISPDTSGFILKVDATNPRSVSVEAPRDLMASDNPAATVTVTAKGSELTASCSISVSNITAEVPKIDNTAPTPPPAPVVGIAVGATDSDESSDAQKTEENLNEIISNVVDESVEDTVKFEPNTEGENVQESIKEANRSGGSIVTAVQANKVEDTSSEEASNVTSAVEEKISQSGAELKVEQKLDITININKVENGNSTSIGKITELPEEKEITFTVLLTEAQAKTKMYVAYNHNGEFDVLPEDKVNQDGGILTFKAQKFSDYYLVSRESKLSVTYKNLTPSGGTKTESVEYGGKLPAFSVQEFANYTFNGWKIEGTNTFWNFAEDRVTTDMTLVGDWTYNRPTPPSVTYYTIRFDSQGGTSVSSQSLTYGSKVKEPAVPVKEGFTFVGWYKEASCTNAWDFAKDTVTSSRTLYAKWTEEPEIPDTPKTPAVSEIISRKGYLEVNLKEAAEGAVGYEYAYGKEDGAWSEADDYTVLGSTTALSYISTDVPAGIYVVKARAYKEVNGEKVYGEWSEGQWTELPTGTLDAPVITGVKVNGRTVTVTLKGTEGAAGYDAVLGETNNPIKPTPYAYLVKNQNTTTLVFKNVADGTYYIGAHAYSKEDGIKYFSKWSNQLQVSVNAGDTPEVEAPGTPTIIGHFAKKGYLKVRIAEGTKDAQGYEYAYSTKDGNWTSEEDYTLFGRTPLLYRASTKIPAGVYAVKVRAFKRVNGERIYGEWSEAEWVELPTGTIKAPKISSVKVKGNTVTVVLTKVDKAVGYDAVLGLTRNPVKPVTYAYVKKNQRSTTIVFRNVKAGTYYIGSHAYTKEDGRKVFSKWSNQKRVTIE